MSIRKVNQIKRLYFQTTEATVERDIERAIALLTTLSNDEERARAAVYMDGLSQMRSEWRLKQHRLKTRTSRPRTERSRKR